MGLADKIADIIRPRPAGLFSTPAPAVHEALSSTSILSGAASEIAREGVRAFIRALERARDPKAAEQADEAARYLGLSPDGVPTYQLLGKLQSVVVKLTIPTDDAPLLPPSPHPVISWGGVPLRGFEEGEYLSIDSATTPAPPVSVTCRIEGGMPTPEDAHAMQGIREVMQKVFHEKLTAELTQGIRNVDLGIVY